MTPLDAFVLGFTRFLVFIRYDLTEHLRWQHVLGALEVLTEHLECQLALHASHRPMKISFGDGRRPNDARIGERHEHLSCLSRDSQKMSEELSYHGSLLPIRPTTAA